MVVAVIVAMTMMVFIMTMAAISYFDVSHCVLLKPFAANARRSRVRARPCRYPCNRARYRSDGCVLGRAAASATHRNRTPVPRDSETRRRYARSYLCGRVHSLVRADA